MLWSYFSIRFFTILTLTSLNLPTFFIFYRTNNAAAVARGAAGKGQQEHEQHHHHLAGKVCGKYLHDVCFLFVADSEIVPDTGKFFSVTVIIFIY